MKDHGFIRAVLHRRAVLEKIGLLGAALVVEGCVTKGDLQQIVSTGNIQSLMQASNKVDEKQEMQIGKSLYGPTIDQSGGSYKNARVQTAMQNFAEPLFKSGSRPDLPWEITVLEDDSVNAWALPGGKVGVNKGLLRYVDSDAELASVLAHEMGHVEGHHAAKEMNSETFNTRLTDIGKDFFAGKAQSKGGAYFSQTGELSKEMMSAIQAPLIKLVSSGYSRGNEFEADENILAVFRRTGYPPEGSYTFFETLLRQIPAETQQTTSLYSKHPETQDRIAALKRNAAGAQVSVKPPPNDHFAQLKRTFPTRQSPLSLPQLSA